MRRTIIAALHIDWPADKLQVYVLDDGNREEFRLFAESAGCGYISRPVHNHAKAGNINWAMKQTSGEFIAIFDCDHVPTRSFLQITAGWFLKDKKLGLLQTPHHFYSPDPFERNLGQFRRIPNEGELFYGLVQDGNDFWNATFFCGSCALIRRTALAQIGGVAVETVTEDAHTSLRIQRNGWNTAYINIPQAAGLATESLSSHIGQRIRWARGMIQILRTDNPLFGRGLRWPQRLCYFNAMLHFLYAVPRLIFLTSPLVFLLFGRSNFFGYWLTIFAYAIPHVFISNLTNSRIQGEYRFSFWNEIYEAVLAPYILLPTLVALINPGKGKFNVTAKGGLVSEEYFDKHIAWPYLALLGLNVLGLVAAVPRYFVWNADHPGTVILNVVWTLYNIIILSVTTAVALESPQRRTSVRVNMETPFMMLRGDGHVISGNTVDISMSGIQVKLSQPCSLRVTDSIHFNLSSSTADCLFTGKVVGNEGVNLRVVFDTFTLEQETELTRLVYSRADSWLDWRSTRKRDRPLRSFLMIVRISIHGFALALRFPFTKSTAAAVQVPEPISHKEMSINASATGTGLTLLLLCCLLIPSARSHAQKASHSAPKASVALSRGGFTDSFELPTLIEHGRNVLSDNDAEVRLVFTLPLTKVVSDATLFLEYKTAAELSSGARINLNLNGVDVSTIPAEKPGSRGLNETRIDLPAELLSKDNKITLRLSALASKEADSSAKTALVELEPGTKLQLAGRLLPLANNLGAFPIPFFDRSSEQPVNLNFVLASRPSRSELQAAGVVASMFGALADARGASFPTTFGTFPAGNAVCFVDRSAGVPSGLNIEDVSGPGIAVRNNPSDESGKVLVLVGENGEQLLAAARGLASRKGFPDGSSYTIDRLQMPGSFLANRAPRWLVSDRPAPIANYASPEQLQVYGTGSIEIYFRLPPDLYLGQRETIPLNLRYRYRGISNGSTGTLTLRLNGSFVSSILLVPNGRNGKEILSEKVPIPVAALSRFGNTLTVDFSFDNQDKPESASSRESRFGSIQKDTTLDLRGIPHLVSLPDLALFAESGFPFTQYADLSQTAVILPAAPTSQEVEAFLGVMGAMGAHTGSPAFRVEVGSSDSTVKARSKDFIVIGSAEDQELFQRWADETPVRISASGFQLADVRGLWEQAKLRISGKLSKTRQTISDILDGVNPPGFAALSFRSPLDKDHTVLFLATRDSRSAGQLLSFAVPTALQGAVSGDASFFNGEELWSFTVGDSYFVGSLNWYQWCVFFAVECYLLFPALVIVLTFAVGGFLHVRLRERATLRLDGEAS